MQKKTKKHTQAIKKILENTGWLLLERIIKIFLALIATAAVARHLGPDQYGILSYAISLTAIFATLGHLGLNGLISREIIKDPKQEKPILQMAIRLKARAYLLASVLLISLSILTEKIDSIEFWVIAASCLALSTRPLEVYEFWFNSKSQSKHPAKIKIWSAMVASSIKIALTLTPLPVVYFALANALQNIASNLFIRLEHLKRKKDDAGQQIKLNSLPLLKEGLPIFIGAICAVIYQKIDTVMLKWMSGSSEAGIYSAAASISESWYFIPVAIMTSIFPKLIELKNKNPENYQKALQKTLDVLFLIALVGAITATLLSSVVITTIFGKDYIQASNILIIHIWASPFIFMRALFSKWILIEGSTYYSLLTQGLGALLNIALNLLLIPEYGAVGAAISTLASYATASFFALYTNINTRPIFFMMSKSMAFPFRLLLKNKK